MFEAKNNIIGTRLLRIVLALILCFAMAVPSFAAAGYSSGNDVPSVTVRIAGPAIVSGEAVYTIFITGSAGVNTVELEFDITGYTGADADPFPSIDGFSPFGSLVTDMGESDIGGGVWRYSKVVFYKPYPPLGTANNTRIGEMSFSLKGAVGNTSIRNIKAQVAGYDDGKIRYFNVTIETGSGNTTPPAECPPHSFGNWTITKQPTATEVGSEQRVCSRCGLIETREIPRLNDPQNPGAQNPNPGTGGSSGGAGGAVENPRTIAIDDAGVPLIMADSFRAFIKGFEDGTFRGNNHMTREEFVTILYRLKSHQPVASKDTQHFSDVSTTRWSFDAIEWARREGIIEANGEGNFRPAEALTRAEMAVMLARTERLSEMAPNTFSDISGHASVNQILMAVNVGIFRGYEDGTFRPDGSTTRYEAVTALVRYLLGGEPADTMWQNANLTLSDVSSTHWAFKYVALAVNGYVSVK